MSPEEYLIRGIPKSEFIGVKKAGDKGEVKRGEGVREGTGA